MADPLDEIRITLRLPGPLRDRLAESAKASARSMNGEIIFRLEEFDELRARLAAAEKLLDTREEALFQDRVRHRKIEAENEALIQEAHAATIAAREAREKEAGLSVELKQAQIEKLALERMVERLEEMGRFPRVPDEFVSRLAEEIWSRLSTKKADNE